eukprot:TRINITY_DN8768_c0_g2_i1.p1 TRINITY_DN8768_c0_g2~~TRINITY_DN8768_c0_g2_i1.p1  ORF type:complete len:342 (+),score=47.24 TRINITY_DN8768_c0_g2_i1:28-1026(+)
MASPIPGRARRFRSSLASTLAWAWGTATVLGLSSLESVGALVRPAGTQKDDLQNSTGSHHLHSSHRSPLKDTLIQHRQQINECSRSLESRVVQVSKSPRIFQIDDFLSDDEMTFLKKHGEPLLQQSLTIDRATGQFHEDKVRTNSQMYLSKEECRDHAIFGQIARRLYRLARVPLGHGEQIQLGRYKVGQKYDCHFDSEVHQNVLRVATVLVYLNDVEAGGDTIFPMGEACSNLNDCCNIPANSTTSPLRKFHPQKGRAMLFFSHALTGVIEPHAMHCSCPVLEGEKWVMQAWFRTTLYEASPHYKLPSLPIRSQNAQEATEGAKAEEENEL